MLARTFRLMGSPRRCSSEPVGSTRKSSITSVNTRGDSQAKKPAPTLLEVLCHKAESWGAQRPHFRANKAAFSGGDHPEIVPGEDHRLPVHT